MEKIGVMAIVEGLSSFLGDMGKMDKSIRDLIPGNSLLERAFNAVGTAASNLASSALRTLEYALGQLLADAIQGVVKFLGEMISGVIDAGDEFARLQIRLERLNFNALTASGEDYNDAMKQSIRLTQEQIDWTIKLGAQTPYDASDIANIYTLARGYGFTAEEAKGLTEAVIDFSSGMGLTNVELERIVINFGQMRQQGKLNAQDLRDLARGAFVPINAILDITAQKLGITTEEFNKLKKAGTLTADQVDIFIEAFEEFVGINFEGAAQRLGNVFQVAIDNIKGMIQDMLAAYVVVPIFMTIGEKIQNITNALTESDELWGRLTGSLKKIGMTVARIIERLFDLMPSVDGIAEGIVNTLEKVSDWFGKNENNIVSWVRDAVTWISGWLVPALQDAWQWLFGEKGEGKEGAIAGFFKFIQEVGPGIMQLIGWIVAQLSIFSAWVGDNQGLINDFFGALGEIISDVLEGLFGKAPEGEGVLGVLKSIMQWVVENKDKIAEFVEGFIKLAVAWDIAKVVGGVLLAVVARIMVALTTLLVIVKAGALIIGALMSPIALLVLAIVGLILAINAWGDEAWTTLTQMVAIFKWWNDKTFAIILAWVANTRQKIITWAATTQAKIAEWDQLIQDKIRRWAISTWNSISQWASNTWTTFTTWVSNTWNSISQWVSETQTKMSSWSSSIDATVRTWAANVWNSIKTWASNTWATITTWITDIANKFSEWGNSFMDVGRNIVGGVIAGIIERGSELINTVVQLALDAYNALVGALQIGSPSKLFMEVGYRIDEGLAAGILGMAKDVGNAMGTVMGQVTAPAFSAASAPSRSVSNNQQYTQNYNLSINSNADSENIISDFEMLQSLAG